MSILHHPPNELDSETLRLQFCAYVHEGTAPEAKVGNYYQRYINPVEIEIIEN